MSYNACSTYYRTALDFTEHITNAFIADIGVATDRQHQVACHKQALFIVQRLNQAHNNSDNMSTLLVARLMDAIDAMLRDAAVATAASVVEDIDQSMKGLVRAGIILSERVCGIVHARTASLLCNCAAICSDLHEISMARTYYQCAINIRDVLFRPQHPSTEAVQIDLYTLVWHHCDVDIAMQFCEDLLSTNTHLFGYDHPRTALWLSNKGDLYMVKGEHNEAISFHNRALSINQRHLHDVSTSTAMSLNNLALVYCAKSLHGVALPLFATAFNMNKAMLGETHRYTDTVRYNHRLCLVALRQ
ncbi:hypothetical protein BC938DRAFT_473528 [Jimgerdemannia flammicorona]|uniref:Uncharacterized protein n=1 Tax=Jimgerdemannia flammicorona TaxID=994334 RepID=A0A433Q490_9FUNG|nr:hypothetical protein BC938DRAFT_473528 [Jimgerdemannia flammicorona]